MFWFVLGWKWDFKFVGSFQQVFKGPVLKIATTSVDSNVVDTDIVASNGVVHAIDTVL